jgi:uncharacterized membrane protein YsdA (DUF1294 family)/cold shock CspA family protein
MRYQGKLVKWNEAKGFGFVVPNGGNQPVFVHARDFSNRQRRPINHALIRYELGSDAKGRCCAVNVRFADEKPATIRLRISPLPLAWTLLFIAILVGRVMAGNLPVIVSIVYLAASLFTFLIYWSDKSAAEAGRRRTPEKRLHVFGLMGGWPGAVLAQQVLRHKSSKRAFQIPFWMTVMLNCSALIWLASPYGTDVRMFLSQLV